jgi:hypothetical protein
MAVRNVMFECDLCFAETSEDNFSLKYHIYGIRGCDIDHIENNVEIHDYPRQEHEYEDVNGKEIHLCHTCLGLLCDAFTKMNEERDRKIAEAKEKHD